MCSLPLLLQWEEGAAFGASGPGISWLPSRVEIGTGNTLLTASEVMSAASRPERQGMPLPESSLGMKARRQNCSLDARWSVLRAALLAGQNQTDVNWITS